MAQPARVLSAIRTALARGGTVVIADEKVADRFYGLTRVEVLPIASRFFRFHRLNAA